MSTQDVEVLREMRSGFAARRPGIAWLDQLEALTAAIAALEAPDAQELIRQQCVMIDQRRREEIAKNEALRDLYNLQEEHTALKQRVEELESRSLHCPGCDGDHVPWPLPQTTSPSLRRS